MHRDAGWVHRAAGWVHRAAGSAAAHGGAARLARRRRRRAARRRGGARGAAQACSPSDLPAPLSPITQTHADSPPSTLRTGRLRQGIDVRLGGRRARGQGCVPRDLRAAVHGSERALRVAAEQHVFCKPCVGQARQMSHAERFTDGILGGYGLLGSRQIASYALCRRGVSIGGGEAEHVREGERWHPRAQARRPNRQNSGRTFKGRYPATQLVDYFTILLNKGL